MPPWRIAVGELRVGPFLVASFQRYPLPSPGTGPLPAAPGSWGSLQPAATGEGEVLLPVPDGEAFWVGLRPRRGRLRLRVGVAVETGRDLLDALTGEPARPEASGLDLAGASACDGVRAGGDGVWPFTREPAAAGMSGTRAVLLTATPAACLLPAASVAGPQPLHGIGGPARPSGAAPTVPPPEATWRDDRAASARVCLVSPDEYADRTGAPPPSPLEPRARYGGWRLP